MLSSIPWAYQSTYLFLCISINIVSAWFDSLKRHQFVCRAFSMFSYLFHFYFFLIPRVLLLTMRSFMLFASLINMCNEACIDSSMLSGIFYLWYSLLLILLGKGAMWQGQGDSDAREQCAGFSFLHMLGFHHLQICWLSWEWFKLLFFFCDMVVLLLLHPIMPAFNSHYWVLILLLNINCSPLRAQ